MIDILIPTFNRSEFIIKNLYHINNLLQKEKLQDKFNVIVSNNCSTDDTEKRVLKVKKELIYNLTLHTQPRNIGGEKNCVFLLGIAKSDHVIFLGDDDYLPDGYLTKLVEISESKEYGVVIPGFSALMPDGKIKKGRSDFHSRENKLGFNAILDFSKFGHQLSGLFFKREGVADAYISDVENRNIYPFIFFISYVMLKKKSIYLPEYQVLVTQGNSKDWKYDDSGLLTEIFKNYRIIYSRSSIKRFLLCFTIMKDGTWRMRLGRNPFLAIKSFIHLLKSKECDFLLKVMLPILYPYLYIYAISSFIRRRLIP